MHNQFFIADTHFGHANILTFKDNNDKLIRPFSTIEEHDETMIDNWNRMVRPVDKVYHLGDAVIHRRNLPTLARLNGKKRLIRGNHDIFPTKEYLPYFDEILAYRVFNEHAFICSHIPIHPDSLSRWQANVHGHLHHNRVLTSPHHPDKRYICVSVEHTNYQPLHLDEVLLMMDA
jgi:calcineurin-like phosphoesterase family protein